MPTQVPAQLKTTFKKVKEFLSEKKDSGEARRLLASMPGGEGYPQYHTAMARIAILEENQALALAHMEKASELAPDDIKILTRIGKMKLENNDREGVRRVAERALQVGSQSTKDLTLLATLFQQLGQSQQALGLLRDAISRTPNDARLRRIAALCHLRLGQMAEGEQCLKDCLRLAPTNHAALVILGELYLAKGDSGSAMKSLKTADNADCPTKLRNRIVLDLAQAYVDQSTLQLAKQQLAQINETGSARYNYIWGQIQFRENDINLALNSLIASKRTLDKVLSKNSEQVLPSQPLPEDAKSAVEQLLGEIAEGLKRLQWNDGAGGEDSSGDSDEM